MLSDDAPDLAPADRALVGQTLQLAGRVDERLLGEEMRWFNPLDEGGPLVMLSGGWAQVTLALINLKDSGVASELSLASLGLVARPERIEVLAGIGNAHSAQPELALEGVLCVELAGRSSSVLRLYGARDLEVFCDFDGTFSRQDVGSTLARQRLGDRRSELTLRFEAGELDAWEYAAELFDGFPLSRAELEGFLETIELDPGARSLVDWCSGRGVPLRILSDGFDHNLERLQVIHDIQFEYQANSLEFIGDRWRIRPGHRNAACGCGTGTCKRAIIEQARADHPGAFCVHIGNGRVSDLCGALASDLAFAKDTLAPALRQQGRRFCSFETLHDVVAELDRRAS